jgi:hypothetical protein
MGTRKVAIMERTKILKRLIHFSLLVFTILLPFLIIAIIQLLALNRLHSNVQALRPGMSISQVQHHMGSKPNRRFDSAAELETALPHIKLVPAPLPAKMRGPLLIYAFKNEGSDFAYLYFDQSHHLFKIITP